MDETSMHPSRVSRRELLKQMARLGAALPAFGWGGLAFAQTRKKTIVAPPAPQSVFRFSPADDGLLEDLEKASFKYFWTQAHPETGIVMDRCHAREPVTNELGSIAATGFGLTALCIGEQRGFVMRGAAESRALNTLRFLWKKLPHHRGFFYHFGNINTGDRLWDSEAS